MHYRHTRAHAPLPLKMADGDYVIGDDVKRTLSIAPDLPKNQVAITPLYIHVASLVPRPFLRTREEFEIRGRRKARERVWQIE